MRTITTTLYLFNELSDEAKEKAIENYRYSDHEFDWQAEMIDTIQAIAEAMNCKAEWYSYDGITYDVSFYSCETEDIEDLSGKRAWAYIWNNYLYPNRKYKTYWKDKVLYCDGRKNWKRKSKISFGWDDCPFTGYCADCCFIEAWKEWKKNFTIESKTHYGSTVEDFISLVAEKLGEEWTNDNEYQMSDEYISDFLEINEYEFNEEGEMM